MSWFSRLRNALNPRRLDSDLADEMADHLHRRVAALSGKGLNADEAQRQARVRFGNTTHLREQSRGIRLWAALEGTLQDVRYAWRGMRKGPVFAATAVLSLALAIGANSAIYSIVDAAILRPLPVSHPEQLFLLAWPDLTDPGTPPGPERDTFSYPEYLEFEKVTKGAARLALFSLMLRVEAQGPKADAPLEKVNKAFVSGGAFDMLGVQPAVGRLFSADEDRLPPGRALAVLSYEYWNRRFQADPSIVGKTIKVDGKPYEITGVARQGFFGVEPGVFVDVWLPATQYDPRAMTNPGWHWFRILGRLTPGTSLGQVQSRLQPVFHRFRMEQMKRYATAPPAIRKQLFKSVIRVHPAAGGVSDFRKTFSRSLWIVFGVAAGILLIACANVASMLLARSTARAPEMAMRISLGAARMRLARQMLTESLTLSLMAGALGWMLARITAPLLAHFLSTQDNPVQFALAINTRVLLFCIGVSTVSAVLFGLVPAWQASRAEPMTALRSSTGSARKLRLGKIFVSVQAACAFCLALVGAAFLFSLTNLLHVNPGFVAQNVAVLDVTNDAGKKPEQTQRELMFQLQRGVASQPGIEGAALAPWPIFEGGGWTQQIIIPGKGPSEQEEILYNVSPGYFATLRTPILAGRGFQEPDSETKDPAPAIVNEAFARKYFGGLDMVGREVDYNTPKGVVRERIIGVVSDARYYNLRTSADPILYLPTVGSSGFTLYVRSPLKLGSVVRIVDRQAQAIGSGMRVRDITTLGTIVGNTLMRETLLAGIGGAFAFFGLLLAGIGLFGLLSYSVGRRTREIGIRAALGAQRVELVTLVLRDVVGLVGGALVVGLAAGLAIMTVFRSLLFGIEKADPIVIGTAMTLFLVTGLLAASLPARRAATVDPISALREE